MPTSLEENGASGSSHPSLSDDHFTRAHPALSLASGHTHGQGELLTIDKLNKAASTHWLHCFWQPCPRPVSVLDPGGYRYPSGPLLGLDCLRS